MLIVFILCLLLYKDVNTVCLRRRARRGSAVRGGGVGGRAVTRVGLGQRTGRRRAGGACAPARRHHQL